jgi:predicted amidohydrolase
VRLALVQQRVPLNDPAAALATGVEFCRQARAGEADLVVFPELWHTGYAHHSDAAPAWAEWPARAETVNGRWIGAFRAVAAETMTAVVISFLRRTASGYTDAAAVIDAAGQVVLVHDKVHTCDFNWERSLAPGTGFATAPVRTRAGAVEMGVMICFDREFPESARALAVSGAELIICPNASLICDDRLGQLRTRAFENMVAVAMANYPIPTMNGRSCVFDGIATAAGRPRDHTVLVAGARAGLFFADIDLAALRAYRRTGLWSADRRRPSAYGVLTAVPDLEETS